MSEISPGEEAKRLPTPAEVLAAHRRSPVLYSFRAACRCGWERGIQNTGKTTLALHEQHQLDMLREAATVRTVEQLEALPADVVIRDVNGHLLTKDLEGIYCWSLLGSDGAGVDSRWPDLPVAVLWQPEATS